MAAPVLGAREQRVVGGLVSAAVFAVAFGWVEAAVVVYLRRIYYPEGFAFPLVLIKDRLAVVEIVREFATLLMLGGAAALGARTLWGRFGLFAVVFGTWDLVYYVGLWLALRWPASLAEWDVLFLLPGIWTGPVWTPSLISVFLIGCGAVLFVRGERRRLAPPRARHWLVGAASLALILWAFLANHRLVYDGGTPTDFPALPFLAGVALGLVGFADVLRTSAKGVRDT